MYPLALCSFISLTIIIERLLFWLKLHRESDQQEVKKLLAQHLSEDRAAHHNKLSNSRNYILRVLAAGAVNQGDSMTKAMESAAADEVSKMHKFMGGLDTIITVAPLLGILGTVVGIIESFDMLAAADNENPRAVTGGIAQALITTATGLSISIATLFPYNYFNSKIKRAMAVLEKYATNFEILCERKTTKELHKRQEL